jgi:hypothetical protein
VQYGSCTAASYICSTEEAGNTLRVGVANEDPYDLASNSIRADTTENSVKIFMSKNFDVPDMEDYFQDNDFMDLKNPSFTYGKETDRFAIQNELRYEDIFLGGPDTTIPTGKHDIYIMHHGVTEDGKVNLTIEIR